MEATETRTDLLAAAKQCMIDCSAAIADLMGHDCDRGCPDCCVECIDACGVLLRAEARDSRYLGRYARLCAEIGGYCSEQCELFVNDRCRTAAVSCRRLLRACETYIAAETSPLQAA